MRFWPVLIVHVHHGDFYKVEGRGVREGWRHADIQGGERVGRGVYGTKGAGTRMFTSPGTCWVGWE